LETSSFLSVINSENSQHCINIQESQFMEWIFQAAKIITKLWIQSPTSPLPSSETTIWMEKGTYSHYDLQTVIIGANSNVTLWMMSSWNPIWMHNTTFNLHYHLSIANRLRRSFWDIHREYSIIINLPIFVKSLSWNGLFVPFLILVTICH
jgi:hypothetical protein